LGIPADSLRVPRAEQRVAILPVAVPAGLPSDLLNRRPDIIAAEYRVLQAYDLHGQARLARLPSLSLTGRAGSASLALVNLLKSGTFGLSSLLSFPIFDPSVTANIEVSKAQTLVAEEEFRRTVIIAFEDVENALTNLASHKAQTIELGQRRDDLAMVSTQVYAQLKEGLVSQLEVFEVERTRLDAEQSLLANHWQTLTDTLSLYKALGGGWPKEVVGATSD
jgi:outer membrane protein TolC